MTNQYRLELVDGRKVDFTAGNDHASLQEVAKILKTEALTKDRFIQAGGQALFRKAFDSWLKIFPDTHHLIKLVVDGITVAECEIDCNPLLPMQDDGHADAITESLRPDIRRALTGK